MLPRRAGLRDSARLNAAATTPAAAVALHGEPQRLRLADRADQSLDPRRVSVETELFGNGRSSSPSNTPDRFMARAFRS